MFSLHKRKSKAIWAFPQGVRPQCVQTSSLFYANSFAAQETSSEHPKPQPPKLELGEHSIGVVQGIVFLLIFIDADLAKISQGQIETCRSQLSF